MIGCMVESSLLLGLKVKSLSDFTGVSINGIDFRFIRTKNHGIPEKISIGEYKVIKSASEIFAYMETVYDYTNKKLFISLMDIPTAEYIATAEIDSIYLMTEMIANMMATVLERWDGIKNNQTNRG